MVPRLILIKAAAVFEHVDTDEKAGEKKRNILEKKGEKRRIGRWEREKLRIR